MSFLLLGFLAAAEDGVDQAFLLLFLHHLFLLLALRGLQQEIRVFSVVALHLLLILIGIHLFGDLLELLHKLFLEVLGASVIVHDLLLQIFELFGHHFYDALIEWSFLAHFLYANHECLQVSSEQFQQIFLVPFILSE